MKKKEEKKNTLKKVFFFNFLHFILPSFFLEIFLQCELL